LHFDNDFCRHQPVGDGIECDGSTLPAGRTTANAFLFIVFRPGRW